MNISLFHKIEDGVAIISIAGRHKQVDIYSRGSRVYADLGKDTFVALHGSKGTSVPNILWHDIEADGVSINKLGAPEYNEPAAMLKAA